ERFSDLHADPVNDDLREAHGEEHSAEASAPTLTSINALPARRWEEIDHGTPPRAPTTIGWWGIGVRLPRVPDTPPGRRRIREDTPWLDLFLDGTRLARRRMRRRRRGQGRRGRAPRRRDRLRSGHAGRRR